MSSFLAFSRRTATTSLRASTALTSPLATRSFSIAASRQASGETKGKIHDSDHTTRKDDRLDVQTDNSASARESKTKDVGGHAVREKDETNSKAKVKEEFPEAPVTIGMEDERGGKGMNK